MNCRAARMRYQQHLDDIESVKKKTETMKRKDYLLGQISETKLKKNKKMENSSQRLLTEADELAKRAECENDICLISESNST